jgi:hypothetical protein
MTTAGVAGDSCELGPDYQNTSKEKISKLEICFV